ncbi:unnamed protein product [Pleuronectes platessa]|uniref:Uncharacterized protein n=1 Tax=Pleuronectes platessa TaxID=8262 RepID=A0A9N7U4J4_PLEPL|nr:unnamed protein product [Pleuronectes platessa]
MSPLPNDPSLVPCRLRWTLSGRIGWYLDEWEGGSSNQAVAEKRSSRRGSCSTPLLHPGAVSQSFGTDSGLKEIAGSRGIDHEVEGRRATNWGASCKLQMMQIPQDVELNSIFCAPPPRL